MQEKQESIKDYVDFIFDILVEKPDKLQLSTMMEFFPNTNSGINDLLKAYRQNVDLKKMFFQAVLEGRLLVVQCLLKNNYINPDIDDNQAICLAAEQGHANIISYLLKDKRVNPVAQEHSPLYKAAANGHRKAVKNLLQDERVNPKANNNQALHAACKNKHLAVAGLLLSTPAWTKKLYSESPFLWACKNGYSDVVKWILEEDAFYDIDLDKAVDISINTNNADLMEVLLDDGRALPQNPILNSMLCNAARLGHEKIVRLLLNDERIDPTKNQHLSIRIAAKYGHLGVTRVLLADGRANPVKKNKAGKNAVIKAIRHNRVEIVKLFLQDSRVNPVEVYNYAAIERRESIITFMLEKNYAKPEAAGSIAFILAVKRNDSELVKRLLALPDIKPYTHNNEAFKLACANNFLTIVDALLMDSRINPRASDNKGIRDAAGIGHFQIVSRLLEDQRINPCANNNQAFVSAMSGKNTNMMKRLLSDKRVYSQLFFLYTCISSDTDKCLLLNLINETIRDFFLGTDLPFNQDIQQLPHMFQCYLREFAERKKEMLDALRTKTETTTQLITEGLSQLDHTFHEAIFFLVQQGYVDEAIQCWMAVPPGNQQYKNARFQAFQCRYSQSKDLKKTTRDAFRDAFPCWLDEKGVLLDFSAQEQLIFDSYLIAASGINIYPHEIEKAGFTSHTRTQLLQYILLVLTLENLSLRQNSALIAMKGIHSTYSAQLFFQEDSKKQLISILQRIVPDTLQSLQDLEQLAEVFTNDKLWIQIRCEINQMKPKNKSLQQMMKVITSFTGEQLEISGSPAKES